MPASISALRRRFWLFLPDGNRKATLTGRRRPPAGGTATGFNRAPSAPPFCPFCAGARPPLRTNRGRSAHTAHEPASPDRCPKPRDASALVLIVLPKPKPVAKPYRRREALLIAKAD